jgi:hypothetical protein
MARVIRPPMNGDGGFSGKIRLGFFSLGVVCPLYFFMQYFFTPCCWWLTQNTERFQLMRDAFIFFDIKNLEVFSRTSLAYSAAGIIAFMAGYHYISDRAVRIEHPFMQKDWMIPKAERVFWLFFLMGFAWKLVKILGGLDITTFYNPSSLFSNIYLAFFLSLNWFHTLALGVINVAYHEAKVTGHSRASHLRMVAIVTNFFIVASSLTSSSDTATIFPVFTILIIRQFYSPIPFAKIAWRLAVGVCLIFIAKQMVDIYNQGADAATNEDSPILFGLFFILFYRVNLSHVLAAIIDAGPQFYPNGTMGQFWVDMLPYGIAKVNVFDGNEFGRAIGVAAEGDFATGVAVTNMGDLFLNWGFAGILFGMLCHGIFYRAMVATCAGRRPSFILIYALLFPILLHGIESPISVLYSTTIKMVAMCLIIIFAVTAGEAKSRTTA